MKRFVSRRNVLRGFAGLGAVAMADLMWPFVARPAQITPPTVKPSDIKLGANLSPLESSYFGLDPADALADALQLNLDFVRLGAYWNDIEQRPTEFDFSTLDPLVEAFEKRGVPIILTIGIKAPVWPEFHMPRWVYESVDIPPTGLVTRSPLLREWGRRFARKVTERYATTKGIQILQVENEPFEPIVPTHLWSLDEAFVRGQAEEIKSGDKLGRPLLVTAYVGTHWLVSSIQGALERPTGRLVFDTILGSRPTEALIDIADIVGFDVYPRFGFEVAGMPLYFYSDNVVDDAPLLALMEKAKAAGKQVMIAECQAKPWEPGNKVVLQPNAPSFRPEDIEPSVRRYVAHGFDRIGLWGIEHWFWHRRHGNPEWWKHGIELLEDRSWLAA